MTIEGPRGPRVVLAGNIASGKSSLASCLAQRLGFDLIEESVDDNPYLERFYADMPRWAFHLNMYFLGSRSQALLAASTSGRGSVFDRSLYEDRLFVDLARDDGVTPEDNYAVFRSLYDLLERLLPQPTVLVYLEVPAAVLRERIAARGRSFEAGLTVDYLERIQARYDAWVEDYDLSSVVRVDTADVDYRADGEALDVLCARIAEQIALAG